MVIELSFVWAGIIAFAVLAYVVLDGFDLGVGILFPFFPSHHDRNVMTNSVAPVWDGNETWLVLGGGGLMAVFPLAYATVLPALYMPIILMLLGLTFRGVAFEFRFRTVRWRAVWDWGFCLGSLLAAGMQGIALGALVQGIHIENRALCRRLVGLADPVQPHSPASRWRSAMRCSAPPGSTSRPRASCSSSRAASPCIPASPRSSLIGIVSLWTPFLEPIYFERWFGWPTAFFSAFVPLLLALCALAMWQGLVTGKNLQPFLAALGLFVLCFAGLGISFYPYIVPGALTIEEAAAPEASLAFLLVGSVVLIPIILAYTGLRLLGLPRQGRPGGGLSLMPRLAVRLMWFVGIWAAGVLAVGIVGYAIKLALGA